jgi:hypothetical protein
MSHSYRAHGGCVECVGERYYGPPPPASLVNALQDDVPELAPRVGRVPGGNRYTQAQLDDAIAKAVAAEREACAEACENADIVTLGGWEGGDDGLKTLGNAARAIRARGTK